METLAKRQAEPDHDPQHADDRHRDEALEHRRHHVLGSHHAAVEERQPGRHEEDEPGGREHPGHVARVDRSAGDRLGRRSVTAPRMLTAAIKRNGNAENSRIRSVLLLTCARVIAAAPPLCADATRIVPVVHKFNVTFTPEWPIGLDVLKSCTICTNLSPISLTKTRPERSSSAGHAVR